jgi:acetolactate synthase-1/2/3 large subunit
MAGKPACTLLHLGPGMANGLANLHNARRARVPLINVVGEHATYHRRLDAPLTSDINGFASPVSGWIRTPETADQVAQAGAEAVAAACRPPGQIATLILPADTAWNEASGAAPPITPDQPNAPGDEAISAAAHALRSGESCALLMNGAALSEAGLELAGKIRTASGARLLADTFVTRIARGAGRVEVERVPYFGEQAEEALAGIRHLILVATNAPVTFFAYPDKPSELTPEGCQVHTLATVDEDACAALAALADALDANTLDPGATTRAQTGLGSGVLDPAGIAASLGHLLPEGAIVVNEAATSGFAIPAMTMGAAPHDWLDLTGGAIGYGLPCATGAAVACPQRKVIALEADGSGMYTLQALWTHARENLDITTVIFSNRKYAILQVEFMRVGAHNPGPKAMSMLNLDNPDLNWVELARGMGVASSRATTADEFNAQFEQAVNTTGPYLIEAVI